MGLKLNVHAIWDIVKKGRFGAYSSKIQTLLVWGEVQESALLVNSQVIWMHVFARTSENDTGANTWPPRILLKC